MTTHRLSSRARALTHQGVATQFEIGIGYLGIGTTLCFSGMAFWTLASLLWTHAVAGQLAAAAETGTLALIFFFFIYGSLIYQFSRTAYVKRCAEHRPASQEHLEAVFSREAARLAVLVPSYKEQPAIVRRALLSAALLDYPSREVVLLIDDPADPAYDADRASLRAMEELPLALQRTFDGIATLLAREHAAFEGRREEGEVDPGSESLRLAELYERAAAWLSAHLQPLERRDPGDVLLAEKVVGERIAAHLTRAKELRSLGHERHIDGDRVAREYRRLANLFRIGFSAFQRKRYANLSHEPNKAMNLNSYIGLMGGAYREVSRADGVHLEPCDRAIADRIFADAEYLITLDADSLLLPEYALRLIDIMERPGSENCAVVQTPYSSIPAPAGTLEYVAGATTDIQYILHQGFTAFDATYWVGANALLRKRALHDIAEAYFERGYRVTRYIQDRTVIEDTESSIDLVARGWRLFNYPERLAYSATPPDFGALLIQRRRWANGGLIILPKLLRHIFGGSRMPGRLVEGFFRVHYLVSIAAISVGTTIVILFPFEENLRNIWLPLSALPYFCIYARDLSKAGYRYFDVVRTYALNLMLIPVNLGGTIKSIEQSVTRRKIPFFRTPKVGGRTSAPLLYVIAEFALLLWLYGNSVVDYAAGHRVHAIFALANGVLLTCAIIWYIGVRSAFDDIRIGLARLMLAFIARKSATSALH